MRLAIWKTETSDKGKGHANAKEQGKVIEGLVNMLKTVVSSTTSVAPQTQYQVALCFWLFSYERDICERIERCALVSIVRILADVVIACSASYRCSLTSLDEPSKTRL